MKNDEKLKNFIFLEKVSESLREAPGGLRRPPEGLSTIFRAWNPMHEKIDKVFKECFAQHVDGAPSTAPSGAKHSFRQLFRLEKSTGRRKIRSRPFNDSSERVLRTKRRLLFGSGGCHRLNLERHSTLGEGSISLLQV